MAPPVKKIKLCTFIVFLKYYRYMWYRWSHLLQPLTSFTPDKVMFKWTSVEQKSFTDIKHIFARDTLLEYPDFNEIFDIHMYASD